MTDELETLRAEVDRLRAREQAMREALYAARQVIDTYEPAPMANVEARWKIENALASDAGSTLPSVAGHHMEMTHRDFQRACQVELQCLERDPNCDNALVRLLCEAVRCSRECCDLAKHGLKIPSTLLTRKQVQPLVEALEAVLGSALHPAIATRSINVPLDPVRNALAHARTLGFK